MNRKPSAATAVPWEISWEDELDPAIEDGRELLLTHFRQGQWEPPVMPSTVRQALEMAKDPDASFGGIAGLLESEPTLTAQLLKLANSPIFGGAVAIHGLRQAIVRVGLRGFVQLLMVASMSKVLVVRGQPEVTARLQERATAVAIASSEIARMLNLDRDSAFTAGVLHDVGFPMTYGLLASCRRHLSGELASSPARQHALAQALHEELGLALVEQWGLPATVAGAVGYHHRPDEGPPQAQAMAFVVAAGIHVADHAGVHPERDLSDPLGERAFLMLGLARSRMGELIDCTRRRLGLAPLPRR